MVCSDGNLWFLKVLGSGDGLGGRPRNCMACVASRCRLSLPWSILGVSCCSVIMGGCCSLKDAFCRLGGGGSGGAGATAAVAAGGGDVALCFCKCVDAFLLMGGLGGSGFN